MKPLPWHPVWTVVPQRTRKRDRAAGGIILALSFPLRLLRC